MENESKKGRGGRKAGGKNAVQKPPGKQTSIWLDANCLTALEQLKASKKHGNSNSKVICKAITALLESSDS